MEVKKQRHLFWEAGFKYGYMLVIYLVSAFALSEIVIVGNDYIATATDAMFAGESVNISSFIVPLILMVGLGAIVAYISTLSGKHFSAYIQRFVRSKLTKHILELPYAYFDENGSGSIMTKLISDMGEVGRFFSEILPDFFFNLITVITITIYLIQMDKMLVLVMFTSYPIMMTAAHFLSKKIASITKKRRNSMDDRAEAAYDAVSGIVVGRSYNLYETLKKRINVIIDDIADQGCKSTKVSSMGFVINNALTTLPIICCYLFALNETVNGAITTGQMLVFVVLLGRIMYPLGDVIFIWNDIREAGVALSRINNIYEEKPEISGEKDLYEEAVKSSDVAVKWKNVTFSYDDERQVLKGTTFEIMKGENVAFAGGSGEGKSTIFRILCGFYRKQGGSYKLFGREYDEWSLQSARKCISLVSQNVFLFPETIWQNVAYGKENATKEEVINACKNANIHDFIESLSDGYDTMVGERGVRLSGGERQRISIARAFLKDAPILLLDEPTAAIDVGTEALIAEAINRVSVGRTVIVIAHRLSTIKDSDKIFVVSSGKIAECGTHEELLDLDGIYAGMYGKEVARDEEE